MNARYLPTASPDEIAAAAAELGADGERLIGVLIADRNHPDLAEVVDALRRVGAPFFGGLLPGLIHEDQRLEEGALVVSLPAEHEPVLIRGLQTARFRVPELQSIAAADAHSQTAIVLVDGLTANVSRLLSELHGRVGNRVNYIGGGAGSMSFVQEPCVFTKEGVFQDAAVVAFVSQRSRIGVRHGWKNIDGPVVATRTDGNVIQELNWKAAFDVYSDTIAPFIEAPLSRENFAQVAGSFPFGIHREGHEDVVRDPVAVGEDGELICVGEVPENAVLNILRGEPDALIEAAAQSAQDCLAGEPVNANSALVVDCVSRTLFLGERFEEELAAVREPLTAVHAKLPLWGMLSLGEISSYGEGSVEFLNKTIVTAVLHD